MGFDTQQVTLPAFPLAYRALLTQTGTAVPTAVILENTFGTNFTLGYNGVGQYYIINIDALPIFVANKTCARISQNCIGTQIPKLNFGFGSLEVGFGANPTSISITSYKWDGSALVNDNMTNALFEILVYP